LIYPGKSQKQEFNIWTKDSNSDDCYKNNESYVQEKEQGQQLHLSRVPTPWPRGHCCPLTNVINSSVLAGKFPKQWKEAIVVPILKKGNPKELKNYRPVSCLAAASKVLEKFVCNQLKWTNTKQPAWIQSRQINNDCPLCDAEGLDPKHRGSTNYWSTGVGPLISL
jgi:hypothetical protein